MGGLLANVADSEGADGEGHLGNHRGKDGCDVQDGDIDWVGSVEES